MARTAEIPITLIEATLAKWCDLRSQKIVHGVDNLVLKAEIDGLLGRNHFRPGEMTGEDPSEERQRECPRRIISQVTKAAP